MVYFNGTTLCVNAFAISH